MLQMYYMQSMEKRKEIVSFFEQKDWETSCLTSFCAVIMPLLSCDFCSFSIENWILCSGQSMEKRKEIVSFFEQKDWENYAIKVHALKSTSLTIGAKEH